MKKLENAVPKRYRAFYITPGLADYTAEGIGAVLVQKPVLDKMNPTFVGMPVVNNVHTDLEPEELFNMTSEEKSQIADGVVAATGYDEESGWYWADMLIWNEETQKNIEDGYSVSCAYDVLELDDEGGTFNNVPYEEEVLDGDYIHMAIVPNPRYERAYIIKNSKPGGKTVKIKFSKKKVNKNAETEAKPVEEEKETSMENAEDGVVELENGEQIPLSKLVDMYETKKEEEAAAMENAGTVYNMDDEVEVDGEKMTVKELLAACGYGKTKENAESPLDEEAEPVQKEMKNSVQKKAPVNKAVRNSAGKESEQIKRNVNTRTERLDRGKSRYGTPVAQKGAK